MAHASSAINHALHSRDTLLGLARRSLGNTTLLPTHGACWIASLLNNSRRRFCPILNPRREACHRRWLSACLRPAVLLISCQDSTAVYLPSRLVKAHRWLWSTVLLVRRTSGTIEGSSIRTSGEYTITVTFSRRLMTTPKSVVVSPNEQHRCSLHCGWLCRALLEW